MTNPNAPSLFPDLDPKSSPVDTEAIAASSRRADYEDRTSEAARDQGWGPKVVPPPTKVASGTEKTSKSPVTEGLAVFDSTTLPQLSYGSKDIGAAEHRADRRRQRLDDQINDTGSST